MPLFPFYITFQRYEQYNESTPFGALMFHTEIPGKNFSNRVGENP